MKLKTNLVWTRVLMTASMLLLVSFVVYWINSQYRNEKQELKHELATELNTLQRDITDSVIFEKYFAPAISGVAGDSSIPPISIIDTTFSFQQHSVILSKWKNKQKLDSIEKTISQKLNKLDKEVETNFRMHTDDSGNRKERTVVISAFMDDNISTDTVPGVVFADSSSLISTSNSAFTLPTTLALRSLLKVMLHDSFNTLSYRLQFSDPDMVRAEFEKGLSKRNKNIQAAWQDDTTRTVDKNIILIKYDNKADKGTLAISGYKGYLVQNILPQLAFATLLLVLVLLSFIVTYKGMKRQTKLNDMKNGLISNMSHELKTPVATVKVALEALDNYGVMTNPQQALEYIQMAKLETQRLEMLINKALNTSLMEQGKITIQKQTTDINELAKETIDLLKIRLQQYDATINLCTHGNDFEVNIDRLHVQGALLNIIDNSLKYGQAPVQIDIDITAGDASVKIDIRDNGPGIPAAHAEQVFEKFFRVPEGDQHNVQGYGLGLSYVQQVVQLHNGVVQLHPSDTGAHFSLQFYKGR